MNNNERDTEAITTCIILHGTWEMLSAFAVGYTGVNATHNHQGHTKASSWNKSRGSGEEKQPMKMLQKCDTSNDLQKVRRHQCTMCYKLICTRHSLASEVWSLNFLQWNKNGISYTADLWFELNTAFIWVKGKMKIEVLVICSLMLHFPVLEWEWDASQEEKLALG